jgi:uncharacterized coiled-coil protein SlyX
MKRLTKLNVTALLFIPLGLACFVLLPSAQAATPELLPAPPPDGAYPGFNTAEGLNALLGLSSGTFNTALGFNTLRLDTTGSFNTAVGGQALLHNNGDSNTAVGVNALVSNTSGTQNTAVGQGALASNTTGYQNTADGFHALARNIDGLWNTATGFEALFSNTNGSFNTANGYAALLTNTTGGDNTANGFEALVNNTTGSANTATGDEALASNTTGFGNTATGFECLVANTTGGFNTAIGSDALFSNNGSFNTAVGNGALSDSSSNGNTAVGSSSLAVSTGAFNTALGYQAGLNLQTGSGNIDIANKGVVNESNTIRIGNFQTRTFIAGIRGRATAFANAIPVLIDSAGQLGTASSSRRFKNDIKAMDKASEAILALNPVTFHYKSDNTNTPQFGLIAEEVAAVNPDLVVRDENGEIYTVRYEAVNAMLLNEFVKEHRTVQELKSVAAKQEATIAKQQKQIEALTAGLQKVSAQLETSRPAKQVAENSQ